jgi:hypothetical protein
LKDLTVSLLKAFPDQIICSQVDHGHLTDEEIADVVSFLQAKVKPKAAVKTLAVRVCGIETDHIHYLAWKIEIEEKEMDRLVEEFFSIPETEIPQFYQRAMPATCQNCPCRSCTCTGNC